MQPFDPSIPVLTEVFAEVAARKAAPEPEPEPEPEPAPEREHAPAHLEIVPDMIQDPDPEVIGAELQALATETWTEPEWKLLEQRIAGRILQQLDARVDATLDMHLRDSLADVLQQAMATLTTELRAGLQHAIDTTVRRAVAQELEHVKNPHRK
ncbi:MAG: hypothetical protein M3Y65_08230 [Pseudomonadota bacterium]|nr:hypothetical protein [Pseudomonadota bacterium]